MADGADMQSEADALEALHLEAWRWAVRLARGDREFAQDILHDAYLAILDGRAKWQRKSSFKTFAFGVIRMTARAQTRKRAILSFRFPARQNEDVPAHRTSDPILQRTLIAMTKLPKRQAEIAELVFAQDLSLEESAEVMGISLGSARTHYARAKVKLRELLGVEQQDD